jgi:hypothetical protein
MTSDRPFPEALKHGDISEIFPDVHFVTGTVAMSGPLPMRFSRNMTIFCQDGALTLVNSLRLSEAGLSALDRLGKVEHVIRLAGFHGMDDPFYKDRYGAKIWSVDAAYVAGFDAKAESYLAPDVVIDGQSDLPLKDARLIEFKSAKPREGLLLLPQEGGILVSGDCLQNWARADRYFSLPARVMMKIMGFIKPVNVGPGWLKAAKPDKDEVKTLLDLDFSHVLPAHGSPVIGDAKAQYAPVISQL